MCKHTLCYRSCLISQHIVWILVEQHNHTTQFDNTPIIHVFMFVVCLFVEIMTDWRTTRTLLRYCDDESTLYFWNAFSRCWSNFECVYAPFLMYFSFWNDRQRENMREQKRSVFMNNDRNTYPAKAEKWTQKQLWWWMAKQELHN